ncbi:PfkB family carbohydrate kinase [Sinomonas cellulolyticus]|uniref:Carbohydrate kinase PfkB domain-containing protein n=1 Tax=Sinomonas cellulolyticus TaxID=2801916 RepID=A0ABS1K3V3_9MICC|nr:MULTISPECIES: PfkB family carbohydrate kinase [Sinomonas]MBL0706037.1 hypothetical protein [Sinomonas cellulolyticus]
MAGSPLDGVSDRAAAVCLCFEVPQATVLAAARAGRAAQATVILDPSPYAAVPAELAECVDALLVNAHEARQMVGQLIGEAEPSTAERDWLRLGAAFAALGFKRVIVTLGAQGAMLPRHLRSPAGPRRGGAR